MDMQPVIFVSLALSLGVAGGCGNAPPPMVEELPREPPPPPRLEPQILDNQPAYTLGWPMTVLAGVLSQSPTAAIVPSAAHFDFAIEARSGGEVIECAPQGPIDGEPEATPLAQGSQTTRELAIDQLCLVSSPGQYTIAVTMTLPELEGANVTGALETVSFPMEVTLPDPPIVARVSAPPRGVLGEPIEATARVTNFGETPVRMAHGNLLKLTIQGEHNGESFSCRPRRRRQYRRPSRLLQGQAREMTVDLARLCPLDEEGTYLMTPQIEIPRAGRGSYRGTLEAASFTVDITAPPAPEAAEGESGGTEQEGGAN